MIVILVVTLLLVSFIGCQFALSDPEGDSTDASGEEQGIEEDTSPGEEPDPLDPAKTRVQFVLPVNGAQTSGAISPLSLEPGEQEVIALNTELRSYTRHEIAADGSVSVDVPSNGVYILGLTTGTSSGIVTSGLIRASDGLASFPVSNAEGETIDLGPLTQVDGGYVGNTSDETLQAAFNYTGDTLATFGSYDISFRKFFNLDINRNGTYDFAEGLRWVFSMDSGQTFELDSYSYQEDTFNVSIEDQIWGSGVLRFAMDAGFEFTGLDFVESPTDGREPYVSGVDLRLPEPIAILDGAGNPVEYVNELRDGRYNHWDFDDPEDSMTLRMFDWDTRADTEPAMPIPGNYTVVVPGNSEYTIESSHFPRATSDSEGYILPMFQFTRNKYGAFQHIHWRWKLVQNGAIVDAQPEVLEELIGRMAIYFGIAFNPVNHLYSHLYDWSTGYLDMSEYNERYSDDDPAVGLRVIWGDVGHNTFNTNFIDNGTAFQFPAGDEPLHFEDDELLGTWMYADGTAPTGVPQEINFAADYTVEFTANATDPNTGEPIQETDTVPFEFDSHNRAGTVYAQSLRWDAETNSYVPADYFTYRIDNGDNDDVSDDVLNLMPNPTGHPPAIDDSALLYNRYTPE